MILGENHRRMSTSSSAILVRCSRTGGQVSSRLIAAAEIRSRIRKGFKADAPDRNRTSARGLGNRCSIH
jgi:hypothetical protein